MALRLDNSLSYFNCPVCGSGDITKLYDLHYADPLMYSTTSIELVRQPELWTCGRCQSAFTQNRVTESDSVRLYSSSTSGERWKTLPFEKEKTSSVVNFYAKHVLFKGCNLIDIGANTGEFLDFAKKHGAVTHGAEYSEESKATLKKKGHTAYTSVREVEHKMDIVTAFDLVEHIYNIPAFFEECRNCLKPGGKLVLFTGNKDCWAFRKAGAWWWYLNFPEHVVFLSGNSIRELSGFRLVEQKRCFNSRDFFDLNFSLTALFNYSKALGIRKGTKPYDGLPSPSPDHVIWVLQRD